ncbi:D-alanyl-D-alanine carboxypeptidase, partial [Streptomyces fradiae]
KTGTLTGASALSGYVADAAGRRLVYSKRSSCDGSTPGGPASPARPSAA